MKLLRTTALGLTLGVAGASIASAQDLTIAIVNNGHMINMCPSSGFLEPRAA